MLKLSLLLFCLVSFVVVQGQLEGDCIELHGRCNFIAAVNPLAKAQCCEGLHCELSLFEGILWPTFACTKKKEKIGVGAEDNIEAETEEEVDWE